MNKSCAVWYVHLAMTFLSKTCRVFPREIHKFLDQEEFFLMPSCPAVIDLMKKYPDCKYIEMDN